MPTLRLNRAIYTREFILLCLVAMLFFSSHHLLTPVVPLYLKGIHINELAIGGIVAMFMLASLIVRPVLGKLTDEHCKKTMMLIGAGLFAVCPLLYLLAATEWAFYVIRILHGLGFALVITASSSYLIYILPATNKAEGLSIHSNAIKMALTISPALALFLVDHHWMNAVFYLAFSLGIGALLIMTQLRRCEPPDESDTPPRGKLINGKAVFPGFIMATNSILFGALIPFVPLIAMEKNLGQVGLFYIIYALSLILSRGLTGPLSDRYGRIRVILPGMATTILAIFLMSLAPSTGIFLLAAAIYGLAAGTVQPSLVALVADKVDSTERGSAMATFTMLSDLGLAAGNLTVGTLGALIGYGAALPVVTAATATGLAALWINQRRPATPVA